MSGLPRRLLGFLIGLDEGGNALVGGSYRETLSGSVGRAAQARKWWAVRIAQPALNAVFGSDHCQTAAAQEAARRTQSRGPAA